MKKAASDRPGVGGEEGILYVVATPIGNLEDITLRALRILKEADLIASEDTRHTRKLLSHFDIHTPLISYYKEKEMSRAREIVDDLLAGKAVALVSDAGTPGVSDPGSILVREARTAGITVVPVPGASALAAAISVSGFSDPGQLFVGFLPAKSGERKKMLRALASESHTLIFYESPRRIVKSLADCLEALGERQAFVGRELTKIHEETLVAPLSEIFALFKGRESIKGEFVVMIAGRQGQTAAPEAESLDEMLVWYRDESGLSMKDAVKKLAKDLGLSRSAVYQQALSIWK